jgi:NADH-quinone oxidoreductase subunit J
MFTEYVYPFELASVILLVGIVAAVALTQREKRKNKSVIRRSRFSSKPPDRVSRAADARREARLSTPVEHQD